MKVLCYIFCFLPLIGMNELPVICLISPSDKLYEIYKKDKEKGTSPWEIKETKEGVIIVCPQKDFRALMNFHFKKSNYHYIFDKERCTPEKARIVNQYLPEFNEIFIRQAIQQQSLGSIKQLVNDGITFTTDHLKLAQACHSSCQSTEWFEQCILDTKLAYIDLGILDYGFNEQSTQSLQQSARQQQESDIKNSEEIENIIKNYLIAHSLSF